MNHCLLTGFSYNLSAVWLYPRPSSPLPAAFFPMVRLIVIGMVILTSLSACDWFGKTYLKDNERVGMPLSVQLEFDPNVIEGGLEFGDPCQQRRIFPVGEAATTIFTKQLGLTFEQVHPPGALRSGVDGTVRIE